MGGKIPRKTAQEAGNGRLLSDVAYARILQVLFERRLPAGAFVSQADLVALTGIQTGPLRDALRILEVEGVVTIHPRTGIQFVKPGLELARSTYQFRELIEIAALEAFIASVSDADVDALLERHRELMERVEQDGLTDAVIDEVERLEQRFHGTIVASLNNRLIDSSYRRIDNYVRLLRLERRLTPKLVLHSLREHVEVLKAARQRKPTAAIAAMRDHFSAALQRSLGVYRA
ncbi:MAG TPA: GntR family transcriptional regulator [Kaistia sp.]|nr:GntR family transcriptional regulator [Kaistia sp.]